MQKAKHTSHLPTVTFSLLHKYISKDSVDIKFSSYVDNNLSSPQMERNQTTDAYKLCLIMRNDTVKKYLTCLLKCIWYFVQKPLYVMTASRHLLYGETSWMQSSGVILTHSPHNQSSNPKGSVDPFYELFPDFQLDPGQVIGWAILTALFYLFFSFCATNQECPWLCVWVHCLAEKA